MHLFLGSENSNNTSDFDCTSKRFVCSSDWGDGEENDEGKD
uniref:Uncharacterized protein n=1 Tax=Parascaris equorum TaxID=6256 RepID=A0A914RUQ0_PAREQ